MITRRGVSVAIAAPALYAAGVVLGYSELTMLAAAAGTALLVGARVQSGRNRVHVRRRVIPRRVTRGTRLNATVSLVHDGSPRPSRPCAVVDRRNGRPVAAWMPALDPDQSDEFTYPVPTGNRGVVDLGPLEVVRVDHFGLWRVRDTTGPTTRVWIHPRVPVVSAPLGAFLEDADGLTPRRVFADGSVFESLRPYTPGDDPRHIHWLSTARVGTPLVREFVDVTLPDVTIVLDTRVGSFDSHRFEEAVEVAAAVAAAVVDAGWPARLYSTCGRIHLEAGFDRNDALDALSEASLHVGAGIRPSIGPTTTVVVVTGSPIPGDPLRLAELAHTVGGLLIRVVTGDGSQGSAPLDTPVMAVTSSDDFVRQWGARFQP